MTLTTKRRLFVEYYLGEANGNAAKAARLAGYADASHGAHLTHVPEIQALIDARVRSVAMTADQLLDLLAEQARGTMADFVSFAPLTSNVSSGDAGQPFIDLKKAHERGKLHLNRQLASNREGRIEIELYDAQAALVHLGRYFKLFTDKVEMADTGAVEIVYVNDWRG